MHSCMQNSSLTDKYGYCECVYNKIKETFPYSYFIYHSGDKEVLNSIALFSKYCLNKSK